jgi:polar amino acid transport system substrate-binding protein
LCRRKCMKVLARLILAELAVAVLALGACASLATTPESGVREALAPSGKLRVGLYPGTPTSFVSDPDSNNPRGVGHDLGRVLAQRLDVPFEPVVLATNGEVLAALKAGIIDLAFTNATAERAKEMDFSPVLLEI